ncbi:flippase [Limnofasciculus baicalensis]|uniref:Flippase n=1 Tax=Limnofasciculus baicalensis BBK-W-15 TaxID=2699891 RepID=A0AAE3KPE1_9CYAN|nr:flippase [Limnofasciculus baicalensis]MCP2729553.1 flippase [Limnofasciculus baicalensis BBK-W-15]
MTQTSLAQTGDSANPIALARSSVVVLALRLAEVVLMYLLQIFLARWMGTTQYGIYDYVMTWALLLAVPTSLGLPRAVVRFINEYREQKKWGLLRGLILGSWYLTIGMGLLIGLLGTGAIFLINYYHHFDYTSVLLIGIWLVPLQGLVLLQEDIARGTENLFLAYTPTKVIWPILVILGGFLFWHDRHFLNGISTIWIALGTLGTVIVIQAGWIWLKFNREVTPAAPVYTPFAWLNVSLPLLLYRTFREILLQTDTLMLGAFIGPSAVGLYSPASKTAFWVSFVLISTNLVVAPAFVVLNVRGDRAELQKLISTVTLWIFWSSSAIALVLFIFAKPILGIFGAEFIQAHWSLKILIIGQLVNALSGAVGNLLAMTGYQNQLMLVSSVTALINLVLNAIAIPLWGIVGAALTTTLTLSIWNVWLVVVVMRNLEVNPTVFSTFLKQSTEK